jgi:hypothetical protein
MTNRLAHRWVWGLLGAGLLAGSFLSLDAAETAGYTSRKPQWWETERPALEEEPGTNLYWQDPHLASWETCRLWPPATNGCPPAWYARAEMLALFRDDPDNLAFATLGPGGPVALSTSDWRSDFSAGVRVVVGKTLGSWYRIEASYFGSHAWDDLAAVRNLDPNDQGGFGNLYSPFSGFGDPDGLPGYDYNEFASIRFSSRLNNGELNLRRRALMRPGSYEASFLLGARYLQIDESFAYETQSATPGPGITTNQLALEADNRLIGVQVGLLSQFLMQPKCWIDFEMKGGIFANEATLDRTYGGPAGQFTGEDERDRTSFVGDLSLQFNYQFAPSWTFYAGYNALWVTGVATGARNFLADPVTLELGPTIVDHAGELVYHGPNIGLVFTH